MTSSELSFHLLLVKRLSLCVVDSTSEQTFIESHNLLDQLSLPIKNAFGKDVTPNTDESVNHVEHSTEQLKHR